MISQEIIFTGSKHPKRPNYNIEINSLVGIPLLWVHVLHWTWLCTWIELSADIGYIYIYCRSFYLEGLYRLDLEPIPTRSYMRLVPYDHINIQTITFFISVLKQDPEQWHSKQWCPGADNSKAMVSLLSDQASYIVRRLYMALKIGKRLNV